MVIQWVHSKLWAVEYLQRGVAVDHDGYVVPKPPRPLSVREARAWYATQGKMELGPLTRPLVRWQTNDYTPETTMPRVLRSLPPIRIVPEGWPKKRPAAHPSGSDRPKRRGRPRRAAAEPVGAAPQPPRRPGTEVVELSATLLERVDQVRGVLSREAWIEVMLLGLVPGDVPALPAGLPPPPPAPPPPRALPAALPARAAPRPRGGSWLPALPFGPDEPSVVELDDGSAEDGE